MTGQRFLVHASYNQPLADDFWDVDAAAKRVKK
jgi:hypothetical protein